MTDVAEIVIPGAHTCTRQTDATVYYWGYNFYGQYGDGTTTSQSSPMSLPDWKKVAQIAAGGFHTCARKTDDTVVCAGANTYGQLGDGTTTQRKTPTLVKW